MMMMMKFFKQNFSKVYEIFVRAEICVNPVKTKTLPRFANKDRTR